MAKLGHKGDGHGHITETPDVSHIKNVDVTHELSDVNVGVLLKFVGALTIMTIVVYILMLILFNFLNAKETRNEPPAGPMAMTEQESLPPEPRLQLAPGFGVKLENGQWVSLEKREPQGEYHVVREQWERDLKCNEADQGRNPGCVPIDQAMQKLLEQGLPSRVPTSAPNEGSDSASGPPTAASSGRVSMKGKQ